MLGLAEPPKGAASRECLSPMTRASCVPIDRNKSLATGATTGELAALIERIQGRAYKVTSLALIRNETGQPLSYSALDNRFEEARKRAAKALDDAGEEEAAAAPVKCFQFRDLRAKAGTDKADATDMREAQQQLGHKSVKTTEIYLRTRAGEKVTPTK